MPIKVFHTSRRTSLGDRVADDLSKGKVLDLMQEMPESRDVTGRASKVMLSWLQATRVDMELGRAVLVELSAQPGIIVQVGLSYVVAALELGVRLPPGARSEAPGSGV